MSYNNCIFAPRMKQNNSTELFLEKIREGFNFSRYEQLDLVVRLALPALVAQLATIAMNYIDAIMVGQLGATSSAAIGLMAPSLWMFSGLTMCAANGFGVQVAHLIGAKEGDKARDVVCQSIFTVFLIGSALGALAMIITQPLPFWLGGDGEMAKQASDYFWIYALSIPVMQMGWLATTMLRCAGNIKFPSYANAAMCVLDVVFNFFLIYPTRTISIGGYECTVWGADLGIKGASIGTSLSMVITMIMLLWFMTFRSRELTFYNHGFGGWRRFIPQKRTLVKAYKIGGPMVIQHMAICMAQIVGIMIVAPLGEFAIAANGFGVTAESICYMPGYGISQAATTIVGQCVGAGRKKLAKQFSYIATGLGMAVMGLLGGVILYWGAPLVMQSFTPVPEIVALGVDALRIEAFAEPFFAASIVACGCCLGAGDTLKPAFMNLGSIWGVRLTLSWLLAPIYGLNGIWFAMAVELVFRGVIFLWRIGRKGWLYEEELTV